MRKQSYQEDEPNRKALNIWGSDDVAATFTKYRTTASGHNERRRERDRQKRLNDPNWRRGRILSIIRSHKGAPLKYEDFARNIGTDRVEAVRNDLRVLNKRGEIIKVRNTGRLGNIYAVAPKF